MWTLAIEMCDGHAHRIPAWYAQETEVNVADFAWRRLWHGSGPASRETCEKLAAYCQRKVDRYGEQLTTVIHWFDLPNLADLDVVLQLAGHDTYQSLCGLALHVYPTGSEEIRLLRDVTLTHAWKFSEQPEKANADKVLAGRRPSLDKIVPILNYVKLWLSNPHAEMPARARGAILSALTR